MEGKENTGVSLCARQNVSGAACLTMETVFRFAGEHAFKLWALCTCTPTGRFDMNNFALPLLCVKPILFAHAPAKTFIEPRCSTNTAEVSSHLIPISVLVVSLQLVPVSNFGNYIARLDHQVFLNNTLRWTFNLLVAILTTPPTAIRHFTCVDPL